MKISRQSIVDAFSSQPLDKNSVRQTERMLKQNNVVAFGSLVAMSICLYLLRNTPHVPAMLVWIGLNVLLSSARWVFVYRPIDLKRRNGIDFTRLDHTTYHLVRFALVCLWAVGGYLFLPTLDDPELFVGFIIMFAGVLTAAAQNNTAATTELPLIYVYPVASGLMVRMLEFGYFFYALIMLFFMVYVSSLVISISKLEKRAQKVELENEDLLKDLTLQKEKADQANTQKSNFMAAASHDLRQPLNSLGLFLYSHRVQLEGEDIVKTPSLDGADRAFTALQDLFDSITEVSRLDEGSIGVSVQSVHLEAVISPVIEELNVFADNKGLRLDYLPSSLCVASDPVLLTRILRNLIGNAIKYTETGSVVVSEIRKGAFLELSVSDTGVGIAEQEHSRIFDEYHQISNKKRQRSDGIGLGLSIVKKISDLLGHPIAVKSVIGEGSSFSLTIPLCPAENQEPVVQNTKIASMVGVKVLLIDDEVDALKGMQAVLQGWGCMVDLAETPEQARDAVRLSKPQIILSDYRLHENINGIELVQSLVQEFDLEVSSLIISGDKTEELIKNAEIHKLPCLDKPVNIALLNQHLIAMVSQKTL